MKLFADKPNKIGPGNGLPGRSVLARYVLILLLASVLFGLNALLILWRK